MMTFKEYEDSNDICTIVFENIVCDSTAFVLIENIIKQFATGDELFFEHYRLDGFYLSRNEMKECGERIPAFFKAHGEYQTMNVFNGKQMSEGEGLTACRCPNDEKIYKMIEKIFHYYLETVMFSPKISWQDFLKVHENYMKHCAKEYILYDYTDYIFSYVDSGTFSIMFNSKKHNSAEVCQTINQMIKGIF